MVIFFIEKYKFNFSDKNIDYIKYFFPLTWNIIALEMPIPSQGHYGFHSFPVVDWFCLFIYLWVLTFPL
jgi:hypothetical protein